MSESKLHHLAAAAAGGDKIDEVMYGLIRHGVHRGVRQEPQREGAVRKCRQRAKEEREAAETSPFPPGFICLPPKNSTNRFP